MTRRLLAFATAVVAVVAATAGTAGARPGQDLTTEVQPPLTLDFQSFTVDPSGTFDALLTVNNVPDATAIAVDIYDRLEPGQALTGEPEGTAVATFPVVTLPEPDANGDRLTGFSIALYQSGQPNPDPAWGYRIDEPGVHPVRVRLLDVSGNRLGAMATSLIRVPAPDQAVDRTDAALLVEVHQPPPADTIERFQQDRADPTLLGQLDPLLAALSRRPTLPATFSVTPDTADRLAGDPAAGPTLNQIRTELAAPERQLLDNPYVRISPASLVSAGLGDELTRQRDLGRRTLQQVLEEPIAGTWQLHDRVDQASLTALRERGIFRTILPGDALDATAGARAPVEVAAGTGAERTLAAENSLVLGLAAPNDPVLAAHRVLGRLAAPGPRTSGGAAIITVAPGLTSDTSLDLVADALAVGSPFFAITTVDRALSGTPDPAPATLSPPVLPDLDPYPVEVQAASEALASYDALVGGVTELTADYDRTLGISAATDLDLPNRRQDALSVSADLQAPFSSISIPASDTVILGADSARLPLQIESSLDYPANVVIELASNDRLEFPNDRIEATLDRPRQVVKIRVKARSPGDTPLRVTVRTPDDGVILTEGNYVVRSTAVSRVGILLTAGALAFLAVWWSRHWYRNRSKGDPTTT